jgi:HAMP domain-containing protein
MSRLRIYRAESGELKYDTEGKKQTEKNELIRKDYVSRSLFYYDPEGEIRCYFVATSDRKEQYMAVYEREEVSGSEDVIKEFKQEVVSAVKELGWEIKPEETEDPTFFDLIDINHNEDVSFQKSDKDKLEKIITREDSPEKVELSVPDDRTAMGVFSVFRSFRPRSTFLVSESGQYDHREPADIVVKTSKMASGVEVEGETERWLDEVIVQENLESAKKSFSKLREGAKREFGDIYPTKMADMINDAGLPEKIGIEAYSKKGASGKTMRKWGISVFSVLTVLLGIYMSLFRASELREIITERVTIGGPLSRIVFRDGVPGVLTVPSWSVIPIVVIIPIYYSLKSILTKSVEVSHNSKKTPRARGRRQRTPSGTKGGSESLDLDECARDFVDYLSTVNGKLESRNETISRIYPEIPRTVLGLDLSENRSNPVLKQRIIGSFVGLFLFGILAGVLLLARSYWTVVAQVLVTALVVAVAVVLFFLVAKQVYRIIELTNSKVSVSKKNKRRDVPGSEIEEEIPQGKPSEGEVSAEEKTKSVDEIDDGHNSDIGKESAPDRSINRQVVGDEGRSESDVRKKVRGDKEEMKLIDKIFGFKVSRRRLVFLILLVLIILIVAIYLI